MAPIDLALMVYDNEDVHEAQLSGAGPCIHHWGIEVEDRDAAIANIVAHGGEIISDPKRRRAEIPCAERRQSPKSFAQDVTEKLSRGTGQNCRAGNDNSRQP